jgi:hypothetical protein
MSAFDEPDDEVQINADLLTQMNADADVLEVGNEAQDVALDLHEAPFSPGTRDRAIEFFQSNRYAKAVSSFRTRTHQGG